MKKLNLASMRKPSLALFLVAGFLLTAVVSAQETRWTEQQANAWYAQQPWPVGANFLPSTAINQLEMWQSDTFDKVAIDRELGWAESIGMNTMRVFLHNLLWEQDPKGFTQRIDTFLSIAARHHIRPVFVLFDSCWDPHPKLGPQHPPIPGVHNSGWVEAPGAEVLSNPAEYPALEHYVKGVMGAFANDPRVLAWDLWNDQTTAAQPTPRRAIPQTKMISFSHCCPRYSCGRAACTPRNRSPAVYSAATGPLFKPWRRYRVFRSNNPT